MRLKTAYKTDSPQAISVLVWQAPVDYTLENNVKADAIGQVLMQNYLATIREEESAVYTCAAQGNIDMRGAKPLARILDI